MLCVPRPLRHALDLALAVLLAFDLAFATLLNTRSDTIIAPPPLVAQLVDVGPNSAAFEPG